MSDVTHIHDLRIANDPGDVGRVEICQICGHKLDKLEKKTQKCLCTDCVSRMKSEGYDPNNSPVPFSEPEIKRMDLLEITEMFGKDWDL